jgi:transposase
MAIRGLGCPVRFTLTAGQKGDAPQAAALIEGLPAEVVMADTAYDADHLRQAIAAKGALAVIPNNPSRALKYPLDKHLLILSFSPIMRKNPSSWVPNRRDGARINWRQKTPREGWSWGLTMPGFFVVHETEYAREFIEAEVASFSFPLALSVFGVPVSQKDIPIFCREVCFANWTSDLRVR